MSAPSTPRSSDGGSPVSCTPEAPISTEGNADGILTPRRKYQQLLAQFDDSDEDLFVAKPQKSQVGESRVNHEVHKPALEQNEGDVSSGEEQEEPVIRPQGRMASRMMGKSEQTTSLTASPESSDAKMLSPNNDTALKEVMTPTAKPTRRLKQKSTSPASSASRQSSPGLFLTPAKSLASDPASISDSEAEDFVEVTNTKFKELLAKKRAENRAARKAAKRAEKHKSEQRVGSSVPEDFIVVEDDDENADTDEEADQRLTQSSKPMRKASKKALEDINRETQRLARNQYLTHQATTKRKVTKQDLFKRFNFRQNNDKHENAAVEPPSDSRTEDEFVMSGALVSSDAEGDRDTPASSPPSVKELSHKEHTETTGADEGLPTLAELLSNPAPTKEDVERLSKTMPAVVAAPAAVEPRIKAPTPKNKTLKRVRVVLPRITRAVSADSSDDDLVIEKPKAIDILKNAPSNKALESNSLLNLRHLANLNSPGKKRPKNDITSSELFTQLRFRARKQALQEKEERINELRAKGVHVETAEEREKAQEELDNLLEKAREEADALAKQEKRAAKREGKEGSGNLFDDDDDSDDEEFDGEGDAEDDLSLSEDEDEDEEEIGHSNPLFDDEAEDDEEEEASLTGELEELDDIKQKPSDNSSPVEKASPTFKKPIIQPRNRKVVLDDDDADTDSQAEVEEPKSTPGEMAAAFGFAFDVGTSNGLELSQAFAGTIGGPAQQSNTEKESLDIFDLSASLPKFNSTAVNANIFPETLQEDDVSQRVTQTPQVHLGISQFQTAPMDVSPSFSELPDPTQDAGFRAITPGQPFLGMPQSTMDTIMMTQETPIPKRKRYLKKQSSLVAVLSDDEDGPNDVNVEDDEEFIVSKDAFSALFKGAKKKAKVEDFDKKKSAAKGLVQEQAEESEDEYAGLGGHSDDESAGELDEETRKMIDEGPVTVDEQQLAAFHADKERQQDEKQINKLYKDVTTGMLRRKRGGDFEELDDSDDDLADRRRRKQEEFARMRRALLADEKVSKLAQNPKQEAFFHAIEDRDNSMATNFLDLLEEEDVVSNSPPENDDDKENHQPTENGANTGSPKKRKLDKLDDNAIGANNQPAPHAPKRVATTTRKMFNPVELRQSLSFICDEDVVVPATQLYSSDHEASDNEGEDVAIAGSVTFTRTNTADSMESSISSRSASLNIVNRLVRRRTSLEMHEQHAHPNQAMAFAAPGVERSFKPPSLLRRATGLSTVSNSSTGSSSKASVVTTDNGSGRTRYGGSKKSNMHYQAKEAERRKAVEAVEGRRRAQLKSLVGKTTAILGALRGKGDGFE